MKFYSDEDKHLFLAEINRLDLMDSEIPEQMVEGFIKNRRQLVSQLKDFRRGQNTKGSWRKNRYSIMKGIRKFHKSTAGKRFHRKLGNYLATRITENSLEDISEVLKSVSSMMTHFYIELGYYRTLDEQVNFEICLDVLQSELRDIEEKMYTLRHNELTEDQMELLVLLTEENALMNSFADISKKPANEIAALWARLKSDMIKSGKSEEEDGFNKLLLDQMKKELGL